MDDFDIRHFFGSKGFSQKVGSYFLRKFQNFLPSSILRPKNERNCEKFLSNLQQKITFIFRHLLIFYYLKLLIDDCHRKIQEVHI